MFEEMVSIGEAASMCEMSVRRVRYLSDQGYITEPFKSISGEICYRLYTMDHIGQIKQIKAFQDEGYTLKAAVIKSKKGA